MLRRVLAMAAVVLVCLAAGCRPKEASPPVVTDFVCSLRATYGDLAVAGTLKRQTAGTLELAFTEPETLNGLTAVWNGETVTLSMYGLSFDVDPSQIPESALGEELIAAFDAALRGEATDRTEDGDRVFEGAGANGAYTLVCNGETGFPKTLTVPVLGLYAEFFDFQ